MTLSRRDALKTLGAAAGAAAASPLLDACGGPAPGSITHLVYLMMENRTYDHYLGARSLLEGRPGDGLAAQMGNADKDGRFLPVFHEPPEAMCVPDPPHSWNPSRTQWNGGKNDGFSRAFQAAHAGLDGTPPLAYLVREDLPVLWALADAYTTCDRWFASVLGPTLPNRMYWHAASSNGCTSNEQILAQGMKGARSIFDALDEQRVDWAYYFHDVPVLALLPGLEPAGRLRNLFPRFLEDAAAGKLPPVTWLDPGFLSNDDHPPHHPLLGEQLIAAIYHALATSPHWAHTLFVITYDEHGGFFDHVAPPTAPDDRAAQGFDQLGFRVPTFVISPFAKQGHVSSVVRNHTSALRELEQRHGLAPLSARDAAAPDLSECLDAARLARGEAAAPIALPAVEIDESKLPAACKGGSDIGGLRDHELLGWAEANARQLGALDRRRFARDDVYGIAEYLDQHGLGRIRR